LTGALVPLFPGGDKVELTYNSRWEYYDKAVQLRRNEMARQVQAVREGIAGIVPLPILNLMPATLVYVFVESVNSV
jgi:hypothetical protein